MKHFNKELSEIVKKHDTEKIMIAIEPSSTINSEKYAKAETVINKILKNYFTNVAPLISTKEFNNTLAADLSVIHGKNIEAYTIREKITNNQTYKESIKKETLEKIIPKNKAQIYQQERELKPSSKFIIKSKKAVEAYLK